MVQAVSREAGSSEPATCDVTGTPASAKARDAAGRAAMASEPSADSMSTSRRMAKGNLVVGSTACKPCSSSLPTSRLLRLAAASDMRSCPEVLACDTATALHQHGLVLSGSLVSKNLYLLSGILPCSLYYIFFSLFKILQAACASELLPFAHACSLDA